MNKAKLTGTVASSLFIILFFLYGCTSPAIKREISHQPWPFHQGNIIHEGYIKSTIVPSLKIRWIEALTDCGDPSAPQEYSSPAAANEKIFFSSLRGSGVRAYDFAKKEILWDFSVEKGAEGGTAFYEGKVYFGANDGHLYAVNEETGALEWSFNASSEILAPPIAVDGMLYVNSANDILYALDAHTGKQLWRYREGRVDDLFSIRRSSSPAFRKGIVYTGFGNGLIVAVGAYDGSLVWKKSLRGKKRGARFQDVDTSPAIDGNRLYIASYDGGLYALNATTGDTIWHYNSGGSATPAFDEEALYFADNDGNLIAVHKNSGLVKWQIHLEEGVATSPIIVGDYIIFGSSHKYLYLADKKNGNIGDKFKASSGFSASPIFYKGDIFAISNAGYLYALRL
ncbi:MAG: PQQ-binding-like beta-propeller repeat protein [Deltaproteobacteria bacterium]|nr:PQQ-binding-like beta-propeller repeat protein [Deltaproteobacteria bacterium]